jgi:3-oxoacyl-[acyl-carrier protein] reductase
MAIIDITGKVALVTGGSRGAGQAVCLALARAGCDVAINYATRTESAEETSRKVQAEGRRSFVVQADVSRADAVAAMVRAVEAALGGIDILINNAGIIRPQRLDQITEADWDELIDVNLKSAFLCIQAVLPGMRARRFGRIINTSSTAAQVGGVVGPHYAAAKAGLLGLTHSYAALLVKEGITVNTVAPAMIETDMVRDNLNIKPDFVPMGRFGAVEEHADVVVTLARNGFITGQTYNVNGGIYFS